MPPEVQELNKQLYAYLDDRLGIAHDPRQRLGLRQVLQLLNLTRDAEGSRLVHQQFQKYVSTTAGAGVKTVAGGVVPEGKVWIVEGSYIYTTDTTPTRASVYILNSPGPGDAVIVTGMIGNATNPTRFVLPVPRRIILCNAQSLYGQVDTLGGAFTITLVTMGWEIDHGDYIQL